MNLGEPLRAQKNTPLACFFVARVGLFAPSPSRVPRSVVPLLSLSQKRKKMKIYVQKND
jgi:hypothetical protein